MTVIHTGVSIPSTRRCATHAPRHSREGGNPPTWNGLDAAFAESTPRIGKKCSGGRDGVAVCLEMQKAPGCPGAFVFLCFYSLCSRETMQLGQLGACR